MDAARAIIAANRYMTLATADANGTPWASPVWFAPEGERDLLWLSDPDARHSRNLATRPRLAIVIFDSRVEPDDAAALYLSAVAEQTVDGIDTYSAHSVSQGMRPYTLADVTGAARWRLYRARVQDRWLLGPSTQRIRCA
jgi:hypothetical protein